MSSKDPSLWFPGNIDKARAALDALVAEIDGAGLDSAALLWIGCGDLETLVRNWGDALWPEIEELARGNVKFRRALRGVWAFDSPEWERRSALLVELGEEVPVSMRFVVLPDGLGEIEDDPTRWRALDVAGIEEWRLPALLRKLADRIEQERAQEVEGRIVLLLPVEIPQLGAVAQAALDAGVTLIPAEVQLERGGLHPPSRNRPGMVRIGWRIRIPSVGDRTDAAAGLGSVISTITAELADHVFDTLTDHDIRLHVNLQQHRTQASLTGSFDSANELAEALTSIAPDKRVSSDEPEEWTYSNWDWDPNGWRLRIDDKDAGE